MTLLPVMAASVADQEECLRRATDEQARVLEYVRSMPRVAFDGVAGSGKTLLAMARTQELCREGKRVLLVCYNEPLGDWLKGQLPADLRPNAWVGHFHSLCVQTCQRAGVPLKVRPKDENFWLYEAPDGLETAAKKLPAEERFDAVIVDEGQDFPSIWFPALRLLSKTQDDHSTLYWFYDPRQNLYLSPEQSALPANVVGPIALRRNCRNTRRISRRCGQIINEEFQPFDQSPDGEDVREVTENSLRDVLETVRRQVVQWTEKAGRLRPSQIAILTPQETGSEWPRQIGTIPLSDDFDRWRRGESILLATHRRFKGLEADALILADVPVPDRKPYFSTADFYVACSRAKHHLTVVSRGGN
jgi:superfamily I DNA/RNA helicase